MTWDKTPWAVGGGAEMSVEVARLATYAATGGAEGIVNPTDLRVTALSVPGAAVRALTGAALINNKAPGGEQQSYAGRNPTEDVVQVAATSSAGPRSSLVIARVEDPFEAGDTYSEPADPVTAQYIFTRVIPNVPPTTTDVSQVPALAGMSAIALARIDQPASTSTITQAMVVDLRKVARPRLIRPITLQGGTAAQLNSTDGYASFPQNSLAIDIPKWANRLTGTVTANAMIQGGGNESMVTRVYLGTELFTATSIDADASVSGAQRRSPIFGVSIDIPVAMRGTRQVVSMASKRGASAEPGRFRTDTSTQIVFDLQLSEVPA